MEQERSDEVPFVERVEQIDRVENSVLLGTAELFDQSLYRRRAAQLRLHGRRFELQVLDAPAEACGVLFPRPSCED